MVMHTLLGAATAASGLSCTAVDIRGLGGSAGLGSLGSLSLLRLGKMEGGTITIQHTRSIRKLSKSEK